jgi:serine/threonine protein kinase
MRLDESAFQAIPNLERNLWSAVFEIAGSIDEDSARVYAFQIACALADLHSLGIIHRDLKPDNVRISSAGALRLIDFGLSFVGAVNHGYADGSEAGEVAESPSCIGTTDCVAPEVLLLQRHTFAVDWWSLGVILYACLTGVPPFHAETEVETHANTMRGEYERLSEEDCSSDARDFVSRLLIVDPTQRLGAEDGRRCSSTSGCRTSSWSRPSCPNSRIARTPDTLPRDTRRMRRMMEI